MKRRSDASPALTRALESRYWKEPEARAVLAAWARTGEPAAVFAHRHGLAPGRLLRWKTRLSSSARKPVFHPVRVIAAERGADTAGREAMATMELIVGGGRRILIRRGFDPALLAELVRAVESLEC